VAVVAVVCAAVLLSSVEAQPYPGATYSYGRAFGTVTTFYRKDEGAAHHLEVNFTAITDLDSGDVYTNFQANMNVRSNVCTRCSLSALARSCGSAASGGGGSGGRIGA